MFESLCDFWFHFDVVLVRLAFAYVCECLSCLLESLYSHSRKKKRKKKQPHWNNFMLSTPRETGFNGQDRGAGEWEVILSRELEGDTIGEGYCKPIEWTHAGRGRTFSFQTTKDLHIPIYVDIYIFMYIYVCAYKCVYVCYATCSEYISQLHSPSRRSLDITANVVQTSEG